MRSLTTIEHVLVAIGFSLSFASFLYHCFPRENVFTFLYTYLIVSSLPTTQLSNVLHPKRINHDVQNYYTIQQQVLRAWNLASLAVRTG